MSFPPEGVRVGTVETVAARPRDSRWPWLEAVPDALLMVAADGTIVDLNHNAELLLGYNRQELTGKPIAFLIPERFRETHALHVRQFGDSPRTRPMGSGLDLHALRKDGTELSVDIALSPWRSPDGLYIACSLRDLRRHEQMRRALEEQLAFEQLVTGISARFANFRFDDLDAEISRALQQITEFLRVDQAAWLRFSGEEGTMFATHFYNAPGVSAPPPPSILHTQFRWYTARLGRGEIIHFENLPDDLPPEATQEREYVIATGMRAHLAIPIKVGGSVAFVLVVVFFSPPRPWPGALIPRLQLLGEIFAGALVRQSAYHAVEESEAKFRLLAETATCGIGVYQGDRFRYVNPRATQISGYSAGEMLRLNVQELLHPDFRAQVLERAQRRLRGEVVPARYELKIVTKQGEERWIDFSASVTQYQDQPAIIGTAFDITNRKRAEAGLQELSGRLIQAQEEERMRIARELHDDLSQRLALLTIGLEGLVLRTDESTRGEQLQILSDQTKGIAADVHQLSRQLHPAQLETLGLVSAVRRFCADLSKQTGLTVEFKDDGVPEGVPPDSALCLYRIVQEGLQNVYKHAGASRARVSLSGGPQALCLAISDDGKGFNPDSLGMSGGLGLLSMRERVRAVDGEFSILSHPGQGTRLEVCVPIGPRSG